MAFAAQVGAGFTAELGAMRISEEIDALEVMSVPSKAYLVATRVVAALIAIIPLYLISLFASFFATKLGLHPVLRDVARAPTTTTSASTCPCRTSSTASPRPACSPPWWR